MHPVSMYPIRGCTAVCESFLVCTNMSSIVLSQEEGRNTWYPTIIGDAGDRWCGQRARLYYGSMTSEGFHDRKFLGRDIVFFRPGEPGMVHRSQGSSLRTSGIT